MEFRILGPMELWSSGQRHHLGWAKERCVLAVLLMSPGRPVTSEALIDKVWDANAPAKAKDLLYPHMTRLRGRLHALGEDVRLEHEAGAYVLNVDPDCVDYHRFRAFRDQARAIADSGHREDAVRLLSEGLRLWHGEPLGGVAGAWAAQRRHGMLEELLAAALERATFELEEGRHTELIEELNDLVARFPDSEKPVELLMLALHRGGRSGEALRTYERTRVRLATELGVSPGAALRELHARILAGDPGLAPPPRPAQGGSPPSDLPRDLNTFTGREHELQQLTAMAEGGGSAVTVVVIDGMAGVGKSVLAVRLAHRLTPLYPDGQIFLDLYGHDQEHEPLAPGTALDRLLRSRGVPAHRIPADLDGRAALWRTELARRRVLLVLDNVLGHEQIQRLLPGAPGCLVVITSRRRLAGLDGVRALSLDVLPAPDAALLLCRAAGLGPEIDPTAVQTVVRLCAYLPLAVQLVGNRLRHRASWTVADLAGRLSAGRLAEIRAENRELRAAFQLSYQGLDEAEQRAFRMLGLHPGTDLTARDAAVLLDMADAETMLDGMHDHHLIAEPQHGRYRFHDLIREYARELAEQDPEPLRVAAVDRLLDHYLAAAAACDRLLFPYRSRATVPPSFIENVAHAREWMGTELDNLLHAARYAADRRRPRHAVLLAQALAQYLETEGHWPEAVSLHERAVEAWRSLGDDVGRALALADLSRMFLRIGRHEEALAGATEGLEIGRTVDDQRVTATLLDQIGLLHWHRSEFDVALGYFEHALSVWHELTDGAGEAEVRNHHAIVLWHLGRYAEAADGMRAALALYEQAGNPQGRQMMLNNIGDIELQLGRYESALDYYQRAAEVKEIARQHQPAWLINVATVHLKLGRADEAIGNYRRALSICREISDPRSEATALNRIGAWYVSLNRDGEALIHFQKALQVARDIAEKYQEASALHNIAGVHLRAGRSRLALQNYEEAGDLARAMGDAYQEAGALDGMAQVLVRTRGASHARPLWRRAYQFYQDLGVPEAAVIYARLQEVGDVSEG